MLTFESYKSVTNAVPDYQKMLIIYLIVSIVNQKVIDINKI